jgi:hypothetical protein
MTIKVKSKFKRKIKFKTEFNIGFDIGAEVRLAANLVRLRSGLHQHLEYLRRDFFGGYGVVGGYGEHDAFAAGCGAYPGAGNAGGGLGRVGHETGTRDGVGL